MVSTRKKKQQNKRFFSQLSERVTDFGLSNHDVQNENIDSVTHRGTSSDNTNNVTQVNYPQVDMNTVEDNFVSKVRSEVDNVLTTVETRVQDAVLTAIENLVIPRVESAMKSTNEYSGRSFDSNALVAGLRIFSGTVEGLQMTASSRISSRTDSNKIDETCGSITVEEGDLEVNEKIIDRQSHAHHTHRSWWNRSRLFFWISRSSCCNQRRTLHCL